MKRLGWVMGLMLGLAGNAGAVDIAGKWGIGATLFNSGVETSLIRGHSDRTAWVFDVGFLVNTSDRTDESTGQPNVTANSDTWRVNAGPGLRRFFRPSSEFSPYADWFVSVSYLHDHGETTAPPAQTTNESIFGVGTGLAFGLEYFTRWHCSIAADTDVFGLRWDRDSARGESAVIPGLVVKSTQNRFVTTLGIAPRLVVRAYF